MIVCKILLHKSVNRLKMHTCEIPPVTQIERDPQGLQQRERGISGAGGTGEE